jgi:hypothetical protein
LYSDDSTLPRSLLALSQRDSSNEVPLFFVCFDFAGALAIAETIPLYESLALPGIILWVRARLKKRSLIKYLIGCLIVHLIG